jgi:hypothetical protein
MARYLVINLCQFFSSKWRKTPIRELKQSASISDRKRIGGQSLGFTRMFALYAIRTAAGRRAGHNYT